MNDEIVLVIGSKAWSSWSLRPWLAAKAAGIPFREVEIKLRQPGTAEEIARYSPSGRVPVLIHGGLTIWDSLAICEYLAELAPEAHLWPRQRAERAVARAVSAEMHSGFHALRKEFPMDFNAKTAGRLPSNDARSDILRAVSILREMRKSFGQTGPFLFGQFTIPDAMFAPVASRFRTYEIELRDFGDDGTVASYCQAVLDLPSVRDWGRAADTKRA